VADETISQPTRRGGKWWILFQALLSIGLLSLLIRATDWAAMRVALAGARPIWIVVAFVIFTAQFWITTVKWEASLAAHGLAVPLGRLLRIVFGSAFFNNFLPGSIGGDGYRILRTWPDTPPRSRALSAVVLERVVGLVALLVIGLIGALVLWAGRDLPVARLYAIAGLLGLGIAAALWLLFKGRLRRTLARVAAKRGKVAAVAQNIHRVSQAHRSLVSLVAYSFLFQLLAVLGVHSLLLALDASVGYWGAALIAAIGGIAAVLPISLNGLGVFEGAFVLVAVRLGAGYDPALAAAVLIRLLVLPLAIIGALVHVADTRSASSPPDGHD